MSQYFPKSHEFSGGNVKVELDLYNFPTKADLKRTKGLIDQIKQQNQI